MTECWCCLTSGKVDDWTKHDRCWFIILIWEWALHAQADGCRTGEIYRASLHKAVYSQLWWTWQVLYVQTVPTHTWRTSVHPLINDVISLLSPFVGWVSDVSSVVWTHLQCLRTQDVLVQGRGQDLRQMLVVLFGFLTAAFHTAAHGLQGFPQVPLWPCPLDIHGAILLQLIQILWKHRGLLNKFDAVLIMPIYKYCVNKSCAS